MTSAIRLCPKCGSEIPADAPEGGCPGCLLETGLGLLPDAPVAAGGSSAVASAKADDGGSAEDIDANAATAGPHSKKAKHLVEMLGELGDYELLGEVGRGGQGVVFCARQKSLNRTVALKVIGLGQWATKAHVKRFRREAEARHGLSYAFVLLFRLVLNRFDCGSQRITCLPNFALKFFLTRFSTVSFRRHDIFSYFPSKQPSKIVPSEIPCRA